MFWEAFMIKKNSKVKSMLHLWQDFSQRLYDYNEEILVWTLKFTEELKWLSMYLKSYLHKIGFWGRGDLHIPNGTATVNAFQDIHSHGKWYILIYFGLYWRASKLSVRTARHVQTFNKLLYVNIRQYWN